MEKELLRAVGLADVCHLVRGRDGGPASVPTLRKYATSGYRPRGHSGPPLILRAVKVGGAYCTLPEWVADFERERARMGDNYALRVRPPRSESAGHRHACRELDRLGVK